MRISDVLHCANKAIEDSKKFFIYYKLKTKLKGNYYKYQMVIYESSLEGNTDKIPYAELEELVQIKDGLEEDIVKTLESKLLIEFFKKYLYAGT